MAIDLNHSDRVGPDEGRKSNTQRRVVKAGLMLAMGVLSSLYIYDNGPWLWRAAFSAATGIKLASSYSVFELVNESGEDLIVEVRNLNARDWDVPTFRRQIIQHRLGRNLSTEFRLPANGQERVILPVIEGRSVGLLGVAARTNWSALPFQPIQKVVLMAIPMHLTSGVHPDYRIPDEGYPVFRIEPDDLEPLAMGDADAAGLTKIELSRPPVP